MRQKIVIPIIALLLINSTLCYIQIVNAKVGEAKVYIVCLSDVPIIDSWIDNTSNVIKGAIDACILKGKYIEGNVPYAHPKRDVDYPPYYEVTPYVVTSWDLYKSIIESYNGVILVNTHGQYLPVPSAYNNKNAWIDKIADAMLNRRLTWVHVGDAPSIM